MRFAFLPLAGLAATATVAVAGPPPSAADKLAAIKKSVADAEAEYRKADAPLGDSKADQAKSEALGKAFDKQQTDGYLAALELAKADPKSAAGFAALEWLLKSTRSYYVPVGHPVGPTAFDLARVHHAADPKIGPAVAVLAYYPPYKTSKGHKEAFALLRAVVDTNPDKTARAQAALGLAWQAKREFADAEYRQQTNENELAAAAEAQFEAVLKEYGDCPNLRMRGARPATATVAGEATPELYELRHLRRGKPAPDINGVDLDGGTFKLSDHKGKVTLLVYWASWCGPCMAGVPHEKELVEKFKGRPFALVGVNGDSKPDAAKKAVETAKITWRSFWDGETSPGGPIVKAWNVRQWPTIYVIDHAGVIRYRDLPWKQLDKPLEELVAAAETAAAAGGAK